MTKLNNIFRNEQKNKKGNQLINKQKKLINSNPK